MKKKYKKYLKWFAKTELAEMDRLSVIELFDIDDLHDFAREKGYKYSPDDLLFHGWSVQKVLDYGFTEEELLTSCRYPELEEGQLELLEQMVEGTNDAN